MLSSHLLKRHYIRSKMLHFRTLDKTKREAAHLAGQQTNKLRTSIFCL